MSNQKPNLPAAGEPSLHPPPPETSSTQQDAEQYRLARQDIETPEDLKLVENFIGNIYGQAKQIDKTNVTPNEFTKGLKFDAEKEILSLRKEQQPRQPHRSPVQPSLQTPVPQPTNPSQVHPVQQAIHNQPQAAVPTGDSLILKHEIDTLKEEIKDIKKLYLEFFKLKQVKGHWEISVPDSKTVNTTSVAKSWNTINKLLKNKTTSFTITYVEDE